MAVKAIQTLGHLLAAIYTRVSTGKGLDSDLTSIDVQRELGEALVKSQREAGWVVSPTHYDDGGFTGGNINRPALRRLIEDIKAGLVKVVVVYKIDRISRSLLDFADLMQTFERYGVAFISVSEQFNTATATGRLMLNMLLSFAQFEREIAIERVRDKVAAARRHGKYLGGTPPYGYNVDYAAKKLVVNAEEARTVRWVFRRFVETDSLVGIARELNQRGLTTKSWTTKKGTVREGGKWTSQHIYRMLNNRTYLGLVVHDGEVYEGEQEAIVPENLWDQVQAVFAKGTGRKRGQQSRETNMLLRGMIRCAMCGKTMKPTYTRKGEKMYRYYVCETAARQGYDACPIRTVPAGVIEEAVLEQLRMILSSPEMVAETYRALRDRACDSDSVGAGLLTEHDVSEHLKALSPVWDVLFPAEQHRIFQELVEEVAVSRDGIDITLRADGLYSVAAELRG